MKNQKQLILIKDLGMLKPNVTSKRTRHYAKYKCHCGKVFNALVDNVKTGKSKSCGCLSFVNCPSNTTHNLSRHRLYKTWNMMMQRCYNKDAQNYKYYGEIGILVCNEWHNITNFINDMFPSYQEGLTLDRKENDKMYSKDNCRWATLETQNRNKRKIISSNTSGYKGVHWNKKSNKWVSQIGINKKTICLGYYDNPLDGALAYDNYVIKNNLENTTNF